VRGIQLSAAQPGGQFGDGNSGACQRPSHSTKSRVQVFGFQSLNFAVKSADRAARLSTTPTTDEIGCSSGGCGEIAGEPDVAGAAQGV